ncbi:MAG: hypothetical protein ACFFB5_20530 [Promethearchaeota archaeon]
MRKSPFINFLMLFLMFSSTQTPVLAIETLLYKINIGDVFEWKFTLLEGENIRNEASVMLVIWNEKQSSSKIHGNTTTCMDYIIPHGLYLGETLTINITTIPNTSMSDTFPCCNGDFPRGLFRTPRYEDVRWVSPYINQFPFIIPQEPDISNNYPNCLFDQKGILVKANLTIRRGNASANAWIKLVTPKSSLGWVTMPVFFSLIVMAVIFSWRRSRWKK